MSLEKVNEYSRSRPTETQAVKSGRKTEYAIIS